MAFLAEPARPRRRTFTSLIKTKQASIKMVVEVDGQEIKLLAILINLIRPSKESPSLWPLVISTSTTTTDSSCNGDSKDTEANIRKIFGNIEDFMITSMASQLDSLAFIKEGSTKRKNKLAKFLDLDIFEQKLNLPRKTLRDLNTDKALEE